MAISYQADGVKMPAIKRREVSLWIRSVALNYELNVGEIAYIFCSDEKILEANRTYLNHDYYTDIITFDYSEGDCIAGDLLISVETVKTNATDLKVDFLEELHRVIIHGILHLCGIDDKEEGARATMESAENRALKVRKEILENKQL